jgi:peptide/nickel transport system permease protein
LAIQRSGRGYAASKLLALRHPLVTLQGQSWYQPVRRRPLGVVCFFILLIVIAIAIFAPVLAPYGPAETHRGRILESPSTDFWLGTDHLGRDAFSRIVYGARISISVGFISVFLGMTGGTVIGLLSGYLGGKFDLAVQRLVDAWITFPSLVLALALVAVLGPSLFNVSLAIALASVPSTIRVVRGSVLSQKELDYVIAAITIGARGGRILFLQIFPNVVAPILIVATASLGSAILAESSLSFLGLGVPPPAPTWGGMLAREGRNYLLSNPMLGVWPGLAIMITVLAFNLFGDMVRDVLDPRLRGGR